MANLRSKVVGGNFYFRDQVNSPASGVSLWEDCPMLAWLCDPSIAVHFFDDFTGVTKSSENWILTQATSGTGVSGTDPGGELSLGAGATTDGQGPQVQLAGTPIKPASGKTIWFEARVKINVLTADVFVGLGVIDTTLFGTSGMTTTSYIGFKSFTGDGVLLGCSDKGGVEGTASTTTLVADTWVKLGFKVDGVSTVTFYVDGVAIASTLATANIPIVGITPSIGVHATGTGTPQLDVDWVRVFQLR